MPSPSPQALGFTSMPIGPATPAPIGRPNRLGAPDSGRFDLDSEALERLTPIVFGDGRVRDLLLAVEDRGEFCAAVAALAARHGLDLPSERVEALLSDARRRWVERWV